MFPPIHTPKSKYPIWEVRLIFERMAGSPRSTIAVMLGMSVWKPDLGDRRSQTQTLLDRVYEVKRILLRSKSCWVRPPVRCQKSSTLRTLCSVLGMQKLEWDSAEPTGGGLQQVQPVGSMVRVVLDGGRYKWNPGFYWCSYHSSTALKDPPVCSGISLQGPSIAASTLLLSLLDSWLNSWGSKAGLLVPVYVKASQVWWRHSDTFSSEPTELKSQLASMQLLQILCAPALENLSHCCIQLRN